ncbi:MAG TPA: 30S ribosomal protein S6 [Candidatus Omnitrophota bacterium]|nr:30S ribosomal protein S6 [Candidatus Omnitrophota bacterium]
MYKNLANKKDVCYYLTKSKKRQGKMTETKEKLKAYSALIIIATDKENVLDDVKKDIKAIITDNSGEVTEEKAMGKRNLTYPINKKPSGIYYEVNFNAMPTAIVKISWQFRINGSIMRALIDIAKK